MAEVDSTLEGLLRKSLGEQLDEFHITPDLMLSDVGLDSYTLIELLVDIEDTFGVEFSDELLVPETFQTPGTLWAAITKLQSE